ncbi:MAG: DUF6687 family protein [Acidimicrobiales bacterium]
MSGRRSLSWPLSFESCHRLDGQPSVVVDGSPAEGTVLTLSHWLNTPCPPGLEADLSAQMAFSYLGHPNLHGDARVVSNNHFDQDGLVSVFALTHPETALARRKVLIDLAAAGDFATHTDRRAARASMTVAAYADPSRSPLGPVPESYPEWTGQLYAELLEELTNIVDHPGAYRHLWAEEDATLTASEHAIASGAVCIEELPALDLAVVTVPLQAPDAGGHRFGGQWSAGLHPMAIHNATGCCAVLVIRDRRYELTYRYETWAQYRSRPVRARVDLTPLAAVLNVPETGGATWLADPVSDLVPRLQAKTPVVPRRPVSLAVGTTDTRSAWLLSVDVIGCPTTTDVEQLVGHADRRSCMLPAGIVAGTQKIHAPL